MKPLFKCLSRVALTVIPLIGLSMLWGCKDDDPDTPAPQNSYVSIRHEGSGSSEATISFTDASITHDVNVSLSSAINSYSVVRVGFDQGAVASYNTANGTSYVAFPEELIDIPDGGVINITPGQKTAGKTITLVDQKGSTELVKGTTYLLPLKITLPSDSPITSAAGEDVIYCIITYDPPVRFYASLNHEGITDRDVAVVITEATEEHNIEVTLDEVLDEDVTVTIVRDASLVDAYNAIHSTSFAEFPEALLDIPDDGLIGITGGKTAVGQTITLSQKIGETELAEGSTYLLPLKITLPAESPLTLAEGKDVIYCLVTYAPDVYYASLNHTGSANREEKVAIVETNVQHGILVSISDILDQDVTATIVHDADLVESYNAANGTSYAEFPDELLSIPDDGAINIAAGGITAGKTISISRKVGETELAKGTTYLLPLRLTLPIDAPLTLVSGRDIIYCVVTYEPRDNYVALNHEDSYYSEESVVVAAATGEHDIKVSLSYATDEDVSVIVSRDASLVETYNTTNGTSYVEFPEELLSIPDDGVITISNGENTVIQTVTLSQQSGAAELVEGTTYLLPLRVTLPEESPLTLIEDQDVIYCVVNYISPAPASASLVYTQGAVPEVPEVRLNVNNSHKASYDVFVELSKITLENVNGTVTVDPSLVESYNSANATNYALFPGVSVANGGSIMVNAGTTISSALRIDLENTDFTLIEETTFLVPLKLSITGENAVTDDTQNALYYLVTIPARKPTLPGKSAPIPVIMVYNIPHSQHNNPLRSLRLTVAESGVPFYDMVSVQESYIWYDESTGQTHLEKNVNFQKMLDATTSTGENQYWTPIKNFGVKVLFSVQTRVSDPNLETSTAAPYNNANKSGMSTLPSAEMDVVINEIAQLVADYDFDGVVLHENSTAGYVTADGDPWKASGDKAAEFIVKLRRKLGNDKVIVLLEPKDYQYPPSAVYDGVNITDALDYSIWAGLNSDGPGNTQIGMPNAKYCTQILQPNNATARMQTQGNNAVAGYGIVAFTNPNVSVDQSRHKILSNILYGLETVYSKDVYSDSNTPRIGN